MSISNKKIGFGLQITGALCLAIVPVFLQELVGSSSYYQYLLEDDTIYQVVIVAITLLFIPQTLYIARVIWRIILSFAFKSIYRTRHGKIAPTFALLAALIFLSVGIGGLLQGAAIYSYSLVREIKEAPEINRQYLVSKANELEKNDGFGSSTKILKQIVIQYPDDLRNESINLRLAAIESAINTASKFTDIGSSLLDEKKYKLSFNSLKTALHIWPNDLRAITLIDNLRRELDKHTVEIKNYYDECKKGDNANFENIGEELSFIHLDLGPLKLTQKPDSETYLKQEAMEKICEPVITFDSSDQFFVYLKNSYSGSADEAK